MTITKLKKQKFILFVLLMILLSSQTNCWSFYGLLRSYSSSLYKRVKPFFIPATIAALTIYGGAVAYKNFKIMQQEQVMRESLELREAIREAIKVNDLYTLKEKIKKIQGNDELFYFGLENAWSLGKLEIFYFLLSQNKGTELLDQYLNKAVKSDDYNVAAELLSMGADPNSTYRGGSPLKFAIENNNQSITKLLLQHGADPLKLDVFDLAFEHNATFVLSEFLKLPLCEVNHKSAEKIYRKSIEQNKPHIAKIFKVHPHFGPNYVFDDGDFPLMVAMSSRQPDQILEFDRDTQYWRRGKGGQTPLIRACATFHHNMALSLIAAGLPINEPEHVAGSRPVHATIKNGHLGFLKKLLYFGASIQLDPTIHLESLLQHNVQAKERQEFLEIFSSSNPRQKLVDDGFRLDTEYEQKHFNEMMPRVRATRLKKLHDIFHSYPAMHGTSPHDKIKNIDAMRPSIGIINDYLALDDMRE